MKRKILSAVLAASFIFSSQSILHSSSQDVHAENTIKIMSLGDSITDGYWEQGGYRKYMYHALEQNGINNIDMVGTKGMNEETYSDSNVTFTYDGNYSGYSGYAIQYMTGTETRQGIFETMQSENMMETYQPDIVLLQIGTNDILSAYNDGITNRLENLCDYILSYLNDDDTLFVSTIPNMDIEKVYDWFWAYGDEYYNVEPETFYETVQNYVDNYNYSIKEMVSKKQSEGITNIQFADINSVVDYKTDLYDGIHPNEQGYQKMGEYWSDVLTDYLNGVTNPNPSVTTSSDTQYITTVEITTTSENGTTELITTEPTTTEVTDITTESPIITYPKGDVNLDGKVTYVDLILLKEAILNGYFGLTIMSSGNSDDYLPSYDVNLDYNINSLDIIELKSILIDNV